MDKQKDIPFFLPKNSNKHPNLFGVHSIFMESIGAVVTKNILNLKKYEKSRSHRHGIFCKKVMKNVRFYQNFWKQRLLIWMTTLALKFSF